MSENISADLIFKYFPNLSEEQRRQFEALDALYRNRRQLARLDLRLLEDAGLEWSEAQAEAARRSWDAPSTWYNFPRGR